MVPSLREKEVRLDRVRYIGCHNPEQAGNDRLVHEAMAIDREALEAEARYDDSTDCAQQAVETFVLVSVGQHQLPLRGSSCKDPHQQSQMGSTYNNLAGSLADA